MNKRIFTEFDSVELAEMALGRLKRLFGNVNEAKINPFVSENIRMSTQDRTFPIPMVNGVVEAFNGFWNTATSKTKSQFEPLDNKSVILSFDISEKDAGRASNLITALGGRNINIY